MTTFIQNWRRYMYREKKKKIVVVYLCFSHILLKTV